MVKLTQSSDRRCQFVTVGPAYIGKVIIFEDGSCRLFHQRLFHPGRSEPFHTDFPSIEAMRSSLEPSAPRS